MQSPLDFDRLCNLTEPVFRMNLLGDAMNRLQDKYDIESGFASFGVCDPTEPPVPPHCANFNNPSVSYGSTLVPCADNECPLETPPSAVPGTSTFYQPKQDHALLLFGCLPPETDYFGIRTYFYEKVKAHAQNKLNCSDAMSGPAREEMNVFPPAPTVQGLV